MAKIPVEVGRVARMCPPSCRKNRSHEPCACAAEAKAILKVEIFAVFDMVRRYRADFSPNPKNPNWPRISNKERFDERGEPAEINVQIPDNIYHAMAKRAIAVINSGGVPQP